MTRGVLLRLAVVCCTGAAVTLNPVNRIAPIGPAAALELSFHRGKRVHTAKLHVTCFYVHTLAYEGGKGVGDITRRRDQQVLFRHSSFPFANSLIPAQELGRNTRDWAWCSFARIVWTETSAIGLPPLYTVTQRGCACAARYTSA